jgi:hypothetical protein
VNPIPSAIVEQLQRLRRRIALWVAVDGLSRILLGAIAFIAVDLLLDWSFQMDKPQRMVMLGLGLIAAAAGLYRRLWRPLSATSTDDALILEVEGRNPDLGESLISAVQFSRHPESSGVSPVMIRATIDKGVAAVRQIQFADVLNRRRLMTSTVLLGVAILLLGGGAVAAAVSDTASIWFNRNILLGDREWPQDVHFQVVGVVDKILTVPQGDDWPLEVLVTEDSRRVPAEVWLEIRGERRRQRLEAAGIGRRFEGRLANVQEPFDFRIVESRAASPWISLQLVQRPDLGDLQLTVTPPGYTGAAAEKLESGGGPYKVLQGSRLSIAGTATKPLSGATLTIEKQQYAASLLEASRFAFEVAPDQLRDGDYAISLVDTESLILPGHDTPQPLTSREPTVFRLRTEPDREPQVQAKLTGIGLLATPRALVPVAGRITDDYGLSDANLLWRWRGEKDEVDTTGSQSLKSQLSAMQTSADFETVLDLEALSAPAGISLSFFIEAADNNSVSGPGLGRSGVFLLRIVTEEEFRAALLAREREQAVELEKRIAQQDELLTDGRALAAGIAGRAEMTTDERGQLDRFRKRQKTIGDDVARIARVFEGIVAEVRQNRIEEESGPVQSRLTEKIVKPLWSASQDDLDAVIVPLESAGRDAAKPDLRDRALAEAVQAQEQLLAKLREIASQMEQAEGFQEAINLLLEVQKAQEDVHQRTEKEKQRAIQELLNSGPAPETPKKESLEDSTKE